MSSERPWELLLLETIALLPQILALDFDGVLCDGLQEYFQVSWRAYRQIWPDGGHGDPAELERRFAPLRAVIETGWEMPVLLRAMATGVTDAEIGDRWPQVRGATLADRDPQELARCLDGVRDTWIADDLDGWLGLHRFYPGTMARLQALLAAGTTSIYIVTTKEGRFVRQLLARAGIEFPGDRVFGKEVQQPKPQTLLRLLATEEVAPAGLWFVEDRLQTLQAVAQTPALEGTGLFLAAWGYNTERDRASVRPPIGLLSLAAFAGEFAAWRS